MFVSFAATVVGISSNSFVLTTRNSILLGILVFKRNNAQMKTSVFVRLIILTIKLFKVTCKLIVGLF